MKEQEGKIVRYTSDQLKDIKDETDWDRVNAMTDEDIEKAMADDPDAAPLLDEEWFSKATYVPKTKEAVTIRLDHDILEFFRKQGKGYQTRINHVLKTYVDAHS